MKKYICLLIIILFSSQAQSHTSHYKLAKGSNTWARLKRDVEASKGDSKKIRKLLS